MSICSYALPHPNFFKFHIPTSSVARALFLYLLPLSGTCCLKVFACVNLLQLSGNTLKHFISNRLSLAPLATHYPRASNSIFDLWRSIDVFTYLLSQQLSLPPVAKKTDKKPTSPDHAGCILPVWWSAIVMTLSCVRPSVTLWIVALRVGVGEGAKLCHCVPGSALLICFFRCVCCRITSYHNHIVVLKWQDRLKVGTEKPKLKVKMQSVSGDDIRKKT